LRGADRPEIDYCRHLISSSVWLRERKKTFLISQARAHFTISTPLGEVGSDERRASTRQVRQQAQKILNGKTANLLLLHTDPLRSVEAYLATRCRRRVSMCT
jgi:hypothetical protein